jgi:hypothetical protein
VFAWYRAGDGQQCLAAFRLTELDAEQLRQLERAIASVWDQPADELGWVLL